MVSNMGILTLGQAFDSFEAFKKTLQIYESLEKQIFTIKNSRKINAAPILYKIEPELIYYEVEYGCIHRGGFRKSGKNIRRSSTVRMSCPAIIKLRASKCGKRLVIRDLKDTHVGHDLSTKFIDYFNKYRKLNEEQLNNIRQNIALEADEKQNQNMFSSEEIRKPISPISGPEKRRKMQTITNSLANLGSLSSNSVFQYRYKLLKDIEFAWKQDKEITIGTIDVSSSVSTERTDNEYNERAVAIALENKIIEKQFMQANHKNKLDEDELLGKRSDCKSSTIQEDQITDRNVYVQKIQDIQIAVIASQSQVGTSNTEQNQNLLNDDTEPGDSVLAPMHMPANIKKRDRPKGADITATGSRKKRAHGVPKLFSEKSIEAKIEIMLNWILANDDALIPVLHGDYVISKFDLQLNPQQINDAILDDSVDVKILEPYLDKEALSKVVKVIDTKRKNMTIWNCASCKLSMSTECIRCDSCLQWYHFYCVGLLSTPKTSSWFCPECYS